MRYNFPRQTLPYRKKTNEWAKDCIKFADTNSVLSSSIVRKTIAHKKLNYDLLNGKLNMKDLMDCINPQGFKYERKDILKPINHYPIINKVINLLVGEEMASQLDYKVVITNPTSISEKERTMRDEILKALQRAIEDESLSDEEYQQKIQEIQKYFSYEYQDIREMRGNELLNHFSKEQNFKNIFNDGFIDVLTVNEALFQITLEHGEPVLRKLNPCKVHVYGNGSSNKVEDADMIVIEDYWQIGRILDTYGDQLTAKDIKYLENIQGQNTHTRDYKYGEYGDPLVHFLYGEYANSIENDPDGNIVFKGDNVEFSNLPYDIDGNVRVLQVYWKSFRKIQEVKYYDPVTGKTEFKFVNEDYIPDEANGEEAKKYYINEAWQGTMIGAGEDAIYVNMGPCPIQYSRMSNPSKCHFGIIGQIFNYNESKPYSIIDQVKSWSYLYDAIMDKLTKTIQNNMGKLVQFNEAMMPEGWKWEDWVYYAKTAGILLVNPMKEGNRGAAKNKLAGAFQVAPVMDAELGNSIQNMVNLLQVIEQTVANMVGITPQRLGAIQNRETVGGVERSTLQSSHVTRWYFEKYNDLKRRVYECFLETAKIGAKGRNIKFQYITSDLTQKVVEFDGDEFAEPDYGLVVNADYDIEKFRQEIDQASQIALQSQMISMSAYMKLKSSGSMAEKIKIIEQNEQEMRQIQQQQAQAQLQQQQAQAQIEMQFKQAELDLKDAMNQRDNDTKIFLETMKQGETTGAPEEQESKLDRDKLNESIRQFNEQLSFDKQKHKDDIAVKKAALNKPKTSK